MEETDFRGEDAGQGRSEILEAVQEGSGSRTQGCPVPADRQDGRVCATLCLQASEVVSRHCVRHRIGMPGTQCVQGGIGMLPTGQRQAHDCHRKTGDTFETKTTYA